MVLHCADGVSKTLRAGVLVGEGGAEPRQHVVVGGADGTDGDCVEGAGEGVDGVVEELEAVVVGGADAGIHGGVGHGRGGVQSLGEVLQRDVEGNVDEVLL